MGQVNNFMHVLPSPEGAEAPSLGAIKRALHALTRTSGVTSKRDAGAVLRAAHELLRQQARRDGIDLDIALKRSRAAAESQRERLAIAGAAAPDPSKT